MKLVVTALTVIMTSVAPLTLAEAPIDYSSQADAYFSSLSHRDHIGATLKGTSCEDAVFTFTIRGDGAELFRRDVPLAEVIPCEWFLREPDRAEWQARHVLNQAVGIVRAVDRSCSLQPGCWAAPAFERLRKANAPLMCFSTGGESKACVAYDPQAKAVIEVRRDSH